MKKSLLLGLASLFLQSAVSLAQAPTVVSPASPPVLEEVSSGPLIAWNNDPVQLPRVWGSSELLMWWTKKVPVNTPLLALALNPLDPNSGKVGSPNTAILLGDRKYDLGTRYGGRFTLGGWFDSEGWLGLEGNYLFISPRSTTQTVNTSGDPGSPNIVVPFRNAVTGKETNSTAFGAGEIFGGAGSSFLHLSNLLQGGELNVLGRLVRTENLSVSGLVGFRYVYFKETLDFGFSNAFDTNNQNVITTQDGFHATNNFFGGNLGLRGEYRMGNFFVEGTTKVALGSMRQVVDVNGSSTYVLPMGPPQFNFTNAPGGIFAQPTNIGRHTHNAFCAVPEVELKIGYNFTRNIQGTVGYNLLYLSDVARPGTLIDRDINRSQVPRIAGFPNTLVGPPAPGFSFNRSDFLAQGVNFGLVFKF